jgi:hypothetical protein
MIDSEIKILERKMKLKRQAVRLVQAELEEIRHQLALLRLRQYLEGKITGDFEPAHSRRLDAVQFLIDELRPPANVDPYKDCPLVGTPAN